jgi:hypothetical protein
LRACAVKIRTRNGCGEWIDDELDDDALAKIALKYGTSVEAVAMALRTYDDIAIEMPYALPAPEMARRLEVDEDYAMGLVVDYVCREPF